MKKLTALLLIILISLPLFACGKDEVKSDDTGAGNSTLESNSNEHSAPPEAPTRPNFQMSDKVDDFTVTINGLIYQLPCSVDLVLNDGWIPKSGYVLEDDYSVPSGDTRGVIVYSENKTNMVTVKSYYPAEGESAYRDGSVIGFSSEEGSTAEVVLSGGLNLDKKLTLQDVIKVFGDNYTYTTDYDGDRYVYRYDGKGLYIFVFKDDQLNYWELRLYKENL